MKFIQRCSYGCANHLATVMNENHNKRSIYYYGFFIIFGALVKGIIMFSIAAILGILVPTLLIMFTFGSLRMIAGGYHMETFAKCLFVSMTLFIIAALTAKYTYQNWTLSHIISLITLTFIIGLYILIKYAPKDTPNKPITDPIQIKKFKKLSLIYLFIWLMTNILLAIYNLNMYVIALSFGVLLELFAISPKGHIFFDIIKNRLDYKIKKSNDNI